MLISSIIALATVPCNSNSYSLFSKSNRLHFHYHYITSVKLRDKSRNPSRYPLRSIASSSQSPATKASASSTQIPIISIIIAIALFPCLPFAYLRIIANHYAVLDDYQNPSYFHMYRTRIVLASHISPFCTKSQHSSKVNSSTSTNSSSSKLAFPLLNSVALYR